MTTNAFVLRPVPGSLPGDTSDGTLDLLGLGRTLWRSKYSILALTALVAAVAVFFAVSLTPIYRATSTLQINDKTAKVVSFDKTATATDSAAANQYLDTQTELLRSHAIVSKVVQDLKLAEHPEFDPRVQHGILAQVRNKLAQWGIGKINAGRIQGPLTDEQVLDQVSARFLNLLSVEQLGKTQLVKIQVEMADAGMAALAANAVADAYLQSQIQNTVGQSNTATAWINGRLGELGRTLKESEDRLQAYKEAEHLVDVQGVSTISASELNLTGERMIDARRLRAEAESQYRQVQKMAAGGWQKLASIPAVLADPVVQDFKAQQAKAQAKVDELAGRYGPRHPAMEAARSDLTAASTSLRSQVEQVAAGIERAYQLAAANENSLQASFNANKSQIQDISRKEFQLRELQREVDGNRALYDTFMTRLRETGATSDLNTADIRVVDPAVAPSAPVKPRKVIIVCLGIVLGLMLGCVLALIREALNLTFRSVEQVQAHLGLPVAGIIPKVTSAESKTLARLYGKDSSWSFNEAVRTLRTGVLLGAPADKGKVVLVTSAAPGEGKSSLAANLAVALGQLERVLLIDADLRRSTLASQLGLSAGSAGLSDVIMGRAALDDCLHKVDGIDVLGNGSSLASPLEVLSSRDMAQTLELLKSRYDRIVIDSPPTLAASDTRVLASYAGLVLYVVEAGKTPRKQVQLGVARLLQQGQAPACAVVLSQVDIKKASRNGFRFDGFYDYYNYSRPQVANH